MFATGIVAPAQAGVHGDCLCACPRFMPEPAPGESGGQTLGARFRGHDEIFGLYMCSITRSTISGSAPHRPIWTRSRTGPTAPPGEFMRAPGLGPRTLMYSI